MFSHKKFCQKHSPQICFSRAHLPTTCIQLQPSYTLIEIKKMRKLMTRSTKLMAKVREFKLNIKYSSEYQARPLPSGGLDLISHHTNYTMLSDQSDFHFHEHDFEISNTILFDHKATACRIPCSLEHNTKFFIGDVRLLVDDSGLRKYRTVHSDYFNSVFMDNRLIGYSICEKLHGYDAVSGMMWSDDGFYDEMILRYTDKATKTADGILIAGLQNENWFNFKDGIETYTENCEECRLENN